MKIKRTTIIGFISGIILGSVISVYATSTILESENVSYDNTYSSLASSNVQDAVDEIYTNYNNKISVGTAISSEILSGKTALVNGSLVTGTMTNYSATSSGLTLTSSDTRRVDIQTLNKTGDSQVWHVANSDGTTRLAIQTPYYGYVYGQIVAISDSDLAYVIGLTSNKIVKGYTIAGVSGTAVAAESSTYISAGTSRSISIKNYYSDYTNISEDNFVLYTLGCEIEGATTVSTDVGGTSYATFTNPTVSDYNSSTGVLTIDGGTLSVENYSTGAVETNCKVMVVIEPYV